MSSYGVISYGAYVPRKRMSRSAIFDAVGWAQGSLKSYAKGARAFAGWDEDAITMSVEAARMALNRSGQAPETLCFASTTAPFLDRQNAGIVAAALDLQTATHCHDAAGSQRAALSALIELSKDRQSASLLAAADKRPVKAASMMEMLSGDAGAAILMGTGEPVAEWLGSRAIYGDLVDHYRTEESSADYVMEERWFREMGLGPMTAAAIAPLLEDAGVTAAEVTHLIAPTANPALAGAVAKAAGINPKAVANSLFDTCGHAGAAHPLLMLTHTLDTAAPGDIILVTAFGQGCSAVLLRVTARILDFQRGDVGAQLGDSQIEENYTRFLAASGRLDIDWGMRAERDNRTAQTVAYNKSRDVYGFVGGVCGACQTPQFPKSRRCVNPECNALDTQTDYRFADRHARIKSFTEDYLAFTREPPLIYGNVSFDGGGNVFMEMTGFKLGEASIGGAVEMNFRIKDIDAMRGFQRYFWKAAPLRGGDNG